MRKRMPKRLNRKIMIYIMTLFVFIMCIIIILAFNKSIRQYYEHSIDAYQDSNWDTFNSNIRLASKFSITDLEKKSAQIQKEIKQLDMEVLKESLTNDKYYKGFDDILRNNLQSNVFQSEFKMNSNHNGIFVICDGRLIADYSHLVSSDYDSIAMENGDSNSKTRDSHIDSIITNNAVNPALCIEAIDTIEKQTYTHPIVWQYNKFPNCSNTPLLSSVSFDDIENIFKTQGIKGLRSYEILIPTYITEYGNIFGDYTSHLSTDDTTNKIIIVQRLNLVDFFDSYYIGSIRNPELESLEIDYKNTEVILLLFEILLYTAIGSYIIFVIFNVNAVIEEYNWLFESGKIDEHGQEVKDESPHE